MNQEQGGKDRALFQPTRWTLIVHARDRASNLGDQALTELFLQYKRPLEIFLHAKFPAFADREDVIQETFRVLIERDGFAKVSDENGRFRDYLKKCAVNVVMETLRSQATAKRTKPEAGDVFWDNDDNEPDLAYDREWAKATVRAVMDRLRHECAVGGKDDFFHEAQGWITGEPAAGEYDRVAGKLGMQANTLRQSVVRMRRRFRDLLHEQVSGTVGADDVEDEMRHLLKAFSR